MTRARSRKSRFAEDARCESAWAGEPPEFACNPPAKILWSNPMRAVFNPSEMTAAHHPVHGMRTLSIDGEPRNDLLGRDFGEALAITQVLELPFKDVAQLRLFVNAELVLLLITHGTRRQPFQNHLDLMLRTWVGSRFGSRRESTMEIRRQYRRKLLDFLGVEKLHY